MFITYLFDAEIGTIEKARGGIRFTYEQEAINNTSIPALSLSLPKRAEPYSNRYAGAFFRNLLPEQSYGRLVAGAIDADLSDSLGMLGAIGGECPGAVSIWPAGQAPPSTHEYTSLSTSELKSLFTSTGAGGIGAAIARGRLSLPGVQQKIALLRGEDNEWMLPKSGAVTSHILKRPDPAFPGLLPNELFSMSLAQMCGLQVAPVSIAADGVDVLSVERYDRIRTDRPLSAPRQKLHQEDFCQALGIVPERKYERDGGPGIARCARLIRENSSLPAEDLPRLVQWVGFNCLIGNEDYHAKNLAFLYTEDGLRLTPYYDLVSTVVYPGLTRTAAMKIGGAWDIRNVHRSDWKRLATQTRLPWDSVRAMLLGLSDSVANSTGAVVDACRSELHEDTTFVELSDLVTHQVAHMRRELT